MIPASEKRVCSSFYFKPVGFLQLEGHGLHWTVAYDRPASYIHERAPHSRALNVAPARNSRNPRALTGYTRACQSLRNVRNYMSQAQWFASTHRTSAHCRNPKRQDRNADCAMAVTDATSALDNGRQRPSRKAPQPCRPMMNDDSLDCNHSVEMQSCVSQQPMQ